MASRPRQPVAKGGLWTSTAQPNVSKETSNLLKVMMEESKLTNLQRRQLQESIQKGQALPVSSNQQGQTKKAPKQKGPVVMNGRSLQYSGKRRKEVIDAIKEQQPKDIYKPTPGKLITDKDKEKLQNVMAFGKDGSDLRRKKPISKTSEPEHIKTDRFDEVMEEIEERKHFLDEMESLGHGAKYRTVISTEISQKIRELELIDKERSKGLDLELKENKDAL